MNSKIDISEVLTHEDNLTSDEKFYRLKIVEKLATEDRPIRLNELPEISSQMYEILHDKGAIVLDENKENIMYAYPVSGPHTNHEIHLADGRVFHSMCAIDSLGSTFTFGQDLTIKSQCSTSGKEVIVEIENGKIKSTNADDIYAIHVDLNAFEEWSASC